MLRNLNIVLVGLSFGGFPPSCCLRSCLSFFVGSLWLVAFLHQTISFFLQSLLCFGLSWSFETLAPFSPPRLGIGLAAISLPAFTHVWHLNVGDMTFAPFAFFSPEQFLI